jgi:hypothetical protein
VSTTQAKTDNKSRSTTEFGLGRNRKLRLARPQAPASGGGLCLARPQAPASGGGLRLARPPDSASTLVLGGIASSPDPGLGLKRSLRLARPWARTDRANRGYIITLFLACSGYKKKTGVPSGLSRRRVMMVPRVHHDACGSQPLTAAKRRQQEPCRTASSAPTGLRCSSNGHAITCTGLKLSTDDHVGMYTRLRHFSTGHVSA